VQLNILFVSDVFGKPERELAVWIAGTFDDVPIIRRLVTPFDWRSPRSGRCACHAGGRLLTLSAPMGIEACALF